MSAPQTMHQPPEKPFCTFSPITQAEILFKARCLIKQHANLNKWNTFQLPHVYGAGVTGALRAGNLSFVFSIAPPIWLLQVLMNSQQIIMKCYISGCFLFYICILWYLCTRHHSLLECDVWPPCPKPQLYLGWRCFALQNSSVSYVELPESCKSIVEQYTAAARGEQAVF